MFWPRGLLPVAASMNTSFILMAQYGTAIVPVERVAPDYFGLTPEKFVRKVAAGEIRIPLVRMTGSQKSARGVHVNDLAAYIDRARREAISATG